MEKLTLKAKKYPGKLIVFEGTDGSGKTTMISMLVEYLTNKYGANNVLQIKQPTDMSRKTKLFQKMMYSDNHDDIEYRAVQLLTMSDRIQHIHEVIEPALKAGKYIVCDRYV
jgi:dTMP kinase